MRSSTALAIFCAFTRALARPDQKPLGDPSVTATKTSTNAPSYRADLLSLHRHLCEINSVTPSEEQTAYWLRDYLEALDYKVWLLPVSPGTPSHPRFNVLAGRNPDKSSSSSHLNWPLPPDYNRVVLTSHIDTVPPYILYKYQQNDTDEADSVISGRGTVDAKGSVAAQIIAHEELVNAGEIGKEDVLLVYVVGEEVDGVGMKFMSHVMDTVGKRYDAAIFGEPTEGKLACGHKGHLGCNITAKGQAGHSGYPWLGKSATELLMRGLVKVLDAELPASKKFGKTTVNVGLLEGGVAANVIPEHASAMLAIRPATGPQETGHEKVQEALEKVLAEVDGEALHAECFPGYGAVETECDVEGFDKITVNYGTDIPHLYSNITQARYLYGPGDILVAHSDHEALTVRNLEDAVEGYKKLIKHALKQNK